MYCGKCGHEFDSEDMAFCTKCGAPRVAVGT
jgi:rRNA maturation endonuclease Nob1